MLDIRKIGLGMRNQKISSGERHAKPIFSDDFLKRNVAYFVIYQILLIKLASIRMPGAFARSEQPVHADEDSGDCQ